MSETATLMKTRHEARHGISLIIPAYNAAPKIEQTIAAGRAVLDKTLQDYEILVVDDGSKDDTSRVAEKHSSDGKVKIIRNPVNKGKGFAFKLGVEAATGKYVILSDADMDIDPNQILSYLNALRDYDLVVASKRHPMSTYKAPLMRKFLSAGFNTLVDAMMGLKLSDTQTGLKAFRIEGIERIMKFVLVKRYAFDVEMLVVAKLLDLSAVEMPVKVNLIKRFKTRDVMYMGLDLLGIFYRYRIIGWYQKNLFDVDPRYTSVLNI